MRNDLNSAEFSEKVFEARDPVVRFDTEQARLHGEYSDQLSAYRAKRVWEATLERNFLLDPEHDFSLKVVSEVAAHEFLLTCIFHTACARYALWRLTNEQALEAQYAIETAHVPTGQFEAMLRSPDLAPWQPEPLVLQGLQDGPRRIAEILKALLNHLKK